LSELKSSETGLLTSIKVLTPTQWQFQPSPDSWSIEKCTEHLILAEDLIFKESGETLQTPAVARLPNATGHGDRRLVAQLEDRTKKAKAPRVIQPTGMFSAPEGAAEEFKRLRDRTIAYVKTTKDPLRIHVGAGPTGSPADVYQFLLELSAHSVRHTAQIREVKSSGGYPSK
jgi:DinB superfamily